MARLKSVLLVCCWIALAGCSSSQARREAPSKAVKAMNFAIGSASFSDGGTIPKQFTCDGENVSPQLSWSGPPAGTKTFALIVQDPDAPAGTWTHWLLFDIPASTTQLSENVAKTEELPDGARQGKNDFGKIGYGGPCPPPGKPHRYFFKLYALGSKINLKAGASKQELQQAMEGYVLAQTEIVGTYGRQ